MDKSVFRRLACNCRVRELVDYLSSCGETEKAQRIKNRFENISRPGQYSRLLNDILYCYYLYYKDVCWDKISVEDADKHLEARLREALRADGEMETLESEIKNRLSAEGIYFLGGRTDQFYSPYIWTSMETRRYDIELPENTLTLSVNFMDGFVSGGWLDYLSLGEIGTGGWVTAGSCELFCVQSAYAEKIDTPAFNVSFLKHEAQHMADRKYGEDAISSKDLEYRAKLVELLYYPDISLFLSFLATADGSDKRLAHSYSEYAIIKALSQRIFGAEYIDGAQAWEGRIKEIKTAARELYYEHSRRMELTEERPIDII